MGDWPAFSNGSERFNRRSVLLSRHPRRQAAGHAGNRHSKGGSMKIKNTMTSAWTMVPAAVVIVAAAAISFAGGATADVAAAGRVCGNHTLQGDYGMVGSGVR